MLNPDKEAPPLSRNLAYRLAGPMLAPLLGPLFDLLETDPSSGHITGVKVERGTLDLSAAGSRIFEALAHEAEARSARLCAQGPHASFAPVIAGMPPSQFSQCARCGPVLPSSFLLDPLVADLPSPSGPTGPAGAISPPRRYDGPWTVDFIMESAGYAEIHLLLTSCDEMDPLLLDAVCVRLTDGSLAFPSAYTRSWVLGVVAGSRNALPATLLRVASSFEHSACITLACRKDLPEGVAAALISSGNPEVISRFAWIQPVHRVLPLASSPFASVRYLIARREDVPQQVLADLAVDPALEVASRVMRNQSASQEVLEIGLEHNPVTALEASSNPALPSPLLASVLEKALGFPWFVTVVAAMRARLEAMDEGISRHDLAKVVAVLMSSSDKGVREYGLRLSGRIHAPAMSRSRSIRA